MGKVLVVIVVAVAFFVTGASMGYDSGVRDTHSFMEGSCNVSQTR